MRKKALAIYLLVILMMCYGPAPSLGAAKDADFAKVDEILQARGQMQEGAWVVRFPRNDLNVTINGEAMPAALGFVPWVAFKDMGKKKTMIMGDLVLLEEEVNPVISVLQEHGLKITALHNHFFYEQPRIMFMHVGGMGDKEALATGLRQALDQTGKAQAAAPPPAAPAAAAAPEAAPPPEAAPAPGPGSTPAPGAAPAPAPSPAPAQAPTAGTESAAAPQAAPAPAPGAGTAPAPGAAPTPETAPAPAPTPAPEAAAPPQPAPAPAPEAAPAPETAAQPAPLTLDTKRVEEIIGHPGQINDQVFKITVGRKGVEMDGVALTASMGLNSWAGFVGSNDQAHVAGDIVMTSKEVNPVIKALKAGGLEVVAVHNHMLIEAPRVFFLHYWGSGPAETLAKAVRAAFDEAKGPLR